MNQPTGTIYQKGFWVDEVPAHLIQFLPPDDELELQDEVLETITEPFKFHEYVLTPERIEKLRFFSQINPDGFRRIWLIFHYQQFKLRQSFQEAKTSAEEWIKKQFSGRQYGSPPRRNQVLKAMTMLKQKVFIEFYTRQTVMSTPEGDYLFNLLAEAAFSSIDDLFCPDEFALEFITSLEGQKLKLDGELWDIILSDDFVDMNFAEVLLPGDIPDFKGLEEYYRLYREGNRSIRPPKELLDLFRQRSALPFDYDIEF